MSTFFENAAGAAATEIPESQAAASDGAIPVYAPAPVTPAPTVHQSEGVVFAGATATATAPEVVNPGVFSDVVSGATAPVPVAAAVEVANDQNNNNGNNGVALNIGRGEVVKRHRGRPRKNEGLMAMQSGGHVVAHVSSGTRGRGRPIGSHKKQKTAATFPSPVSTAVTASAGIGFTPYIITVSSGEDVVARLMSCAQVNNQTVCILSANGTLSGVTLRQASSSGGTVTHEGLFDILSLAGSFVLVESVGQRRRMGGLSISVSGPNGGILGGSVAGLLTAASAVQITVGTYLAEGQQEFTPPPKHFSSVGGSPLSESSGGPGSASTRGFDNSTHQTVQNLP